MTLAVATLVLTVPLFMKASAIEMDPALSAAHSMFYNGRYADAVAATAALCTRDAATLAACELRTSALHFRLRDVMGNSSDKQQQFTQCAACPDLLATFELETKRGQETARKRLIASPGDDDTLFYLGKLDLNYVWMQLGTLGRRSGWSEYWEARRSLDKVLKQNPRNVRAKVARAWIDYAVATNMAGGMRWLLGGGSRKRGLQAVREAAVADATRFVRAEASFSLWDMQVRERDFAGARATALGLASDFPDNPDLRKFLEAHAGDVSERTGK
jgi:hypothetical protein